MTEAQIKDARRLFEFGRGPSDVSQLEAQDIITRAEARQILGIDPPDADAPADLLAAPDVQLTIHTCPADTNRYTLNTINRIGYNPRNVVGG